MFIDFFLALRHAGIAASVGEFLSLLAMLARTPSPSIQSFYYLARMCLVKDESRYDKFDMVFGQYVTGLQQALARYKSIPDDWLANALARLRTETSTTSDKLPDPDTLRARLDALLEEQQARHAGGTKWIGTGGTSPFGNAGESPGGMRMAGTSGHHQAGKVWEQRLYKDYDNQRPLDSHNMGMALRRLRQFARKGAAEELALEETVRATANNAGHLQLAMRAPRHNHVRLLMLLDVGGSMDEHVAQTEALFGAVRAEFRQMDFFYFHNCVYDHLWKSNARRLHEQYPTLDLLHAFPPDTRLVFVGDARMSPYEIIRAGGAIDMDNKEPGVVWLQRLLRHFPHHAWLNPEPQRYWHFSQSLTMIRELLDQRMYPLTVDGITDAMRQLSR